MSSSYLTNPVIFLISIIFGAYCTLLLLRFLFQLINVDFHNPFSQFIVKLTSPVLVHLRRFISSIKGLDIASLVAAWGVKTIELTLIGLLSGHKPGIYVLFWPIPALVDLVFNIFIISIFIMAILSWIPQMSSHPLAWLLRQLNYPILSRIHKLLPPISGFDLSPMVAIIGLIVLKMLILPPLKSLFNVPPGIVL